MTRFGSSLGEEEEVSKFQFHGKYMCLLRAPDNATNLKIAFPARRGGTTCVGLKTTTYIHYMYCTCIEERQSEFFTCMGCQVHQVHQVQYFSISPFHKKLNRSACGACLITSEELKSPPTNAHQIRTTDSILGDHQSFIAAGGKLNKAKLFNNGTFLQVHSSSPSL